MALGEACKKFAWALRECMGAFGLCSASCPSRPGTLLVHSWLAIAIMPLRSPGILCWQLGLREARAADDVARLEVEARRVNHISELSADHSFEVRQIK